MKNPEPNDTRQMKSVHDNAMPHPRMATDAHESHLGEKAKRLDDEAGVKQAGTEEDLTLGTDIERHTLKSESKAEEAERREKEK